MSDPSQGEIKITKEYCSNGFTPFDLQWTVASIDSDITLYDIFLLVYQAENIMPGICCVFGMIYFDEFWRQINTPRDPDDKDEIDYLELYWGLSYDTRITFKTGKSTDQKGKTRYSNKNYWDDPQCGDMSNLMSFHGIGQGCPYKDQDLHECGDDCPTETGYAIEFTPVNNLAHLPIRMKSTVEFFPPFVESDRDFHRTGFKLIMQPTLWCLITSILWELTFIDQHPEIIVDKAEEMLNRVKNIRQQYLDNKDVN